MSQRESRATLAAALCAIAAIWFGLAGAAPAAQAQAVTQLGEAKPGADAFLPPPIAGMPSGRTSYRALADYQTEMLQLANDNPDRVKMYSLPHRTLENRPVFGIEITNDVRASDGKPVLLMVGAHHGNEWPSAEHTLEFGYDLLQTADSSRAVEKLLDRVRVVLVPIVNVDGFVHNRRQNCRIVFGQPSPEPLCWNQRGIVDINRNFPYGWGGPGSASVRGEAPGSEPEIQNVMELASTRQATVLLTNHTSGHILLRPPTEKREGLTPDEEVFAELSDAMTAQNGYVGGTSGDDYETTGETIGWSYYATRGLAYTFEIVQGGATPPYQRTLDDYAGIGQYAGKPNRNAFYVALQHAADPRGHAVIAGRAPRGAVLRITKAFTLWTAPITAADGSVAPPQAVPTRLESTLEGGGRFEWHVNPSVRPDPPYKADGVEPTGQLLRESWRLTCERPSGQVLQTQEVTVDMSQKIVVNLERCKRSF